MQERRRRARVASACAALALVVGCTAGEPAEPGRVLLIGIDGASPRLVAPLIEAGRMPHLASLAKHGAHGPLLSHHPLLSPRVWTSVATGKKPDKHGITDWVKPTGPKTVRLFYGSDRKGHALWNIVSAAGRTVGVVNWLMTYPPEAVRGVLVSDHAISREVEGRKFIGDLFARGAGIEPIAEGAQRGAVVYPESWRERALDERHAAGGLTNVRNPFLGNEALPWQAYLHHFTSYYDTDEQIASMALEVESELHPDLLMVLFQGIDRVSHWLWGGVEPLEAGSGKARFTPEEQETARQALEAYYEFTDALIGRFLERYGQNDLVVVVSDHGFEAVESGWLTGGHDSPNAENGVVFARGPRIARTSEPKMGVDDVTPLILAWLGEPVARDMDGRVPDFLTGDRVGFIDSYDTTEIFRLEGASGSDEVLMQQLRELGYVQ